MTTAPVSKAEVDFALHALRAEGVRIDGRALSACRRLGIRFGAAHGEVEVTLGPTRVLAVCSGEIVTPPPERPNEGRITFHAEFGPIASPNFEAGRPSVQATAVANLIERLIRGSRAVDSEALCIVGGQKVWSIRVDVRALDDDGNLADACAIAALCSLLHFRKAEVEREGETAKVYSAEERVPVPLSIHHLPVPITFGLIAPPQPAAGGAGKRCSREPTWILDPNRLEEVAMDGTLCVAVNQHGELCGLHKPGGLPIDFPLISVLKDRAVDRAKEITARIQAELEADLASRQQARRNVHEQFAKEQLLTVDWDDDAADDDAAAAPGAPLTVPLATRSAAPAPAAPDAADGAGGAALGAGQAKRGKKKKRRRGAAVAQGAAAAVADGGEGDDDEEGRDIEAELATVKEEKARLEAQLAAAESSGAGSPAAAVGAGGDGAAAPKRKGRKKRRTK